MGFDRDADVQGYPPLFLVAVEMAATYGVRSPRRLLRSESAGDFLPPLHHAESRPAWCLVNGTSVSLRKGNTSSFAASLRRMRRLWPMRRRLRPRFECLGARLNTMEDPAPRSRWLIADVGCGRRNSPRGAARSRSKVGAGRPHGAAASLHLARPILLVDLDQRLQLAHMIRIAHGVKAHPHVVVSAFQWSCTTNRLYSVRWGRRAGH